MAAPTVTTSAPTAVQAAAATGNGAVTNGGVTARTNICKNPKPSHSQSSIPDQWYAYQATGSTFAYDNGGTVDGIVSKKISIVGGGSPQVNPGVYLDIGASGSMIASHCRASATIGEATLSGCTIRFSLLCYDASNTYVGAVFSTALSVGAGFSRIDKDITLPANTNHATVILNATNDFSGTDSMVLSIAEVMIEPGANLSDWFSGDTIGAYWTGAANASISVFDGITARGTCWGAAANPDTAGSHTSDTLSHAATNVSAFTSALTGLTPGGIYHARAYGTNADGTGYGADVEFAALSSNLPVIGCAFIKGGRQCQ